MKTAYKNLLSGKVEAVFEGCETQSPIFNNKTLYEKIENWEGILEKKPFTPKETLEEKIRRIAKEEIGRDSV